MRLTDVKKSVNRCCKMIYDTLEVDVEVLDDEFNKISGKGSLDNVIDKSAKSLDEVHKNIFKKKKIQFIEKSTKGSLCRECIYCGKCFQKIQLSYPIIYEDNNLGVISIVSRDEKQNLKIKENIRGVESFLKQMAEFIIDKLIESENFKFLNKTVHAINDGIIILQDNNVISSINYAAMKTLKMKSKVIGKSIDVREKGSHIDDNNIYELIIDEKRYEVVGKKIDNDFSYNGCKSILILNKLKNITEESIKLAYGNNKINVSNILGQSKEIMNLKNRIKRISNLDSTVLITGESGTGKELVARAIHAEGQRRNKPFIAINCGAIPEALLESELFGYVKGAFSGADVNGRMGKFELANEGVIFLDEIADMPLYLQVKLLRVLQERAIIRVGSNKLIPLDLRVVAATNKDLKDLINKGEFREDLYYRLNVIPLEIPSLRERTGDLELLVTSLINKYNILFNKHIEEVEDDVMDMFNNYRWYGNIRELENVVEFMVSLSDGTNKVDKSMLSESFIKNFTQGNNDEDKKNEDIVTLKEIERIYIEKALDKYGRTTEGKKKAAKKLGIGIATLYRKIEELSK